MSKFKKLDLSTLGHKILDIEAMLEVSIGLQCEIMAQLTNGDIKEIKEKKFNEVERVSEKLFDKLDRDDRN